MVASSVSEQEVNGSNETCMRLQVIYKRKKQRTRGKESNRLIEDEINLLIVREMKREMRELILIVFLLLPGSLIAQTSYYVSSSEGNDSKSGTTTSEAWKSLEKVNSFKPSAGDKILFKRGDEWVGTLTPSTSGSAGNPITYGAYGTGDKPKIYGSTEITGWTVHKGNIYKAVVKTPIKQVFIDNLLVKAARFPKSGYSYPNKVLSTTEFYDSSLDSGIDYTGANCYYRGLRYKFDNLTITASSGQNLTLSAIPQRDIETDKGYILTNKLEFLTQAGEWYYDTPTNTLYLWTPDGDSPDNHKIRGSIHLYGVYDFHKSNLTFENIQFYHTADRGFFGNNVNNIVINKCDFYYSERFGIRFSGGSQSYITITNCKVIGANDSGISLFGPNSNISDNIVSDVALFENIGIGDIGTGIGIKSQGANNIVQHNRISNIGYNGIDFFGENQLISKNYIVGAQVTYDDGGGIYTVNAGNYSDVGSAGSVISYNIIKNVRGNPEGTSETYNGALGIYLDRNVHDVIVEHNTLSTVSGGIILGQANGLNIIRNNTIMDFTIAFYMGDNHPTDLNDVNNNIAFASEELRSYPWWQNKPQRLARIATVYGVYRGDHNKFYQNYNNTDLFDSDGNGIFELFPSWQSTTGQASNSTIDTSPLGAGEIEELFYNATKQTKAIDLGTSIYRDLDGKEVSGSISLEPFTSQILIKTTKELAKPANKVPEISDQSFEINDSKEVNDLIGQIIANDEDTGQVLTYTIVEGNENKLFALDALTGELVANTSIPATADQTIVLTVQVTDNGSTPLSASAQVSIRINAIEVAPAPDTTAPTIASFSIPSTHSALTVPIAEFTASDNIAVDGYQLTETTTAPTDDDSNWKTSAPGTYTFLEEGTHTLYAWVKDAAGNISPATSSSVSITLPDLSPTFSEYLFEEPAGETVVDTQGSNDGTLLNEELRVKGVNGDGLQLTGKGYISLGNSFGENIQDELTLSAWIQPQSISNGYQGIIMHGGPNVDSYALYIHAGDQSISFKTSGTSSSWTSIGNIASLWDGNWHHVAVTYDGSQKVIYLDDEILLTMDATGSIESGEGYNLLIGAGRDEENPDLLYEGLIDEVRIHNTALTSAEISELYDRGNIIPNQSPEIQAQSFKITAPKSINELIGTIAASDADADQALNYTITAGSTEGLFKINPETGEIFANTNLAANADQTITLLVTVTDNHQDPLSASANVTITIQAIELNQSPTIEDQTVELKDEIQINDFILQVVASDPDADQKLTYAIIQGNEAGLFKINPETGEIFANATISSTIDQSFSLVVQVTDNAENPLSANADITIISLKIAKINQSPVAQNLTVEIEGNFEVNDWVGKMIASDPDVSQLLTYTITGGNEEGLFDINPQTGEIHAAADFISTTDQTVVLAIEVKDNADEPLATSATATINIAGIQLNQSPTIEDQTVELKDEIQINDFILQMVASDPDADQKLTYAIIQGNEAGLFKINPQTGEIFANATISSTIDQSFSLVVQVTDNAENPLSANADITIISLKIAKINQSPVAQNLTVKIEGNFEVNDWVGKMIASDPDAGQLLTYTITGGNEEGLFDINPQTGEIHAAADFISTTDQTVVLTIEVKDNADEPLATSATATINIAGIQLNQSPTIEDQTVELKDEIQINDFILQMVASDPDADQKLTYAIIQGNEAGLFKINPQTGEIFANATISSTIDQSFSLVVQVTDNAENPLSANADITIISLKIAKINQSPVAQNLTVEIEGNFEVNDWVGKIVASDPDAGQLLTYTITGGNEEGLFNINPQTGEIHAAADFISTTDQAVVLTIEVEDNADKPLAASATATINITGIQLNQSPTIEDQTVELKDEIQINDFILQVVASDPDADQKLTYAIIQGNEAGLFKINPETGEIFADTTISTTIDQSFSLVVQVTDNAENPLSANADITIISLKIAKINQSPVAQNLTVEIEGNLEVNDWVGKIVASDPDAGQLLTYTITSGNEEGLFDINAETGEIRAAADFITTTDQTVILTIEVKDNADEPLAASATATINITGIQLNQSPMITDQSFEIDGDLASNEFIGHLIASDPDGDQKLSYSIVQGNEAGLFKLNPETGEIFANQAISVNSNEILTFIVQVTDNHQMPLSAHANVTIHITPAFVNQSPVIDDQSFEIRKNNKLGDRIGQVLASDPNAEQSLTFDIISGNEEGVFAIDPATGGLYATDAIQLTTSESIVVEVEVTDNAAEPLSASAYITINIVINGKIVDGEVKNNNPKRIILSYSEPLETDNLKSSQINSDFILSDGNLIQQVTISGNDIYLDLESGYECEDEIIVSYSRGTTPIYDQSGNEMASFDNYTVTNNILIGNGVNTGIDPTANALDVMVYPNPSNGQFNIRANNLSSDDCELFLFSMTGNMVSKKLVSASFGNLEERLNLSHLNKGTYIIKLISKRQIFQDKIVIM